MRAHGLGRAHLGHGELRATPDSGATRLERPEASIEVLARRLQFHIGRIGAVRTRGRRSGDTRGRGSRLLRQVLGRAGQRGEIDRQTLPGIAREPIENGDGHAGQNP